MGAKVMAAEGFVLSGAVMRSRVNLGALTAATVSDSGQRHLHRIDINMVPFLAAIGAFIAVNAFFAFLSGFLCGVSRTMLVLIRLSYFSPVIRAACFFAAIWAGVCAFQASV